MLTKTKRQSKTYHAPKLDGEKRITRPHCKFCGGLGIAGEPVKRLETKLGTHYRIPASHTACANSLSLSLVIE